MVRFIYNDYNVGKLYGIQIGKYRFTSYVTPSKDPNRSKDLHLSYCRQRTDSIYEVKYTKDLRI